ncbi:MAG TPA: DUF4012 domain-containing protein [Patescibacteria group bacterium]|jgi:hypothetical protein|nr:DUF4012 domain-containing protein [Patescibacteria group bacterium]
MTHTALISSENNQDQPILVVDRKGEIGEALIKELKEQALIVYVSRKVPQTSDNVIHVPFDKQFPTIPDNNYSHIFLIDENFEITKDVVKAFLQKAEQNKAYLVLVVNASFVQDSFPLDFISSYDKAKIVVLGDIFKQDALYNSGSEINKYITKIKSSGRIDIPGDGTRLVVPVCFDDVVFGILETVFGAEENKIFYLFPKHRITLLSLAHIFQKINPDLKVDFVKEDKSPSAEFKPSVEGKYLLGETYDLENKIKGIKFADIKTESVKEEKFSLRPKSKRKLKIKALVLSLLLLLVLPLIATILFAAVGAGALLVSKNEIVKGDFSASKAPVILAANSFSIAQLSLQVLSYETKLVGLDGSLSLLSNDINLGRDVSGALTSAIDASDKMRAVLTGSSKNPATDFSSATMEIKSALYIYDQEKQAKIIPASLVKPLDNLAQVVSSTIDFWPEALGFQGTKNYLILFQNNMELRPGGGFIGSYALATLNRGKIVSFKIYDVYDADGQLKGHIEPPFPIRRYLPSIHWYLRDSNFNVDFSKGAVASAVFLNTEMQQTVDGVIGVDLSFIKNLLTVIGPVNVPDYNQTVNADNFYQVTQAHADDNFFPGSTQKKDFLTSFYNALQAKIAGQKNLSYLSFAQALIQSINEKHVLFAFNNSNEQTAFAVNGWSSALVQDTSSSNSLVDDFIGINEANLGGNKVNYDIARSVSQTVTISSDKNINEALTVSFKNSAPQNSGDKGVYKNYLRFILPFNVTITGIQIDGQEQKIIPAITDPTVYEKKGFVPPTGLEVQREDESGRTTYGFLVTISPQNLKTIKVSYTLAQKINTSQPQLGYQLKVFKQPGIDFMPYDLSLNFPSNLKVVKSDTDIKPSGQSAVLSTQITQDREVSINLAAK